MMNNEKFEICSLYRREDFDFDHIQRDKNNPLDQHGYPIYPLTMPSEQGSSYTYKISNDWFFKRKLQDGGHPHLILSQHHFNQAYNELYGTFDDLGEVIAYYLANSIIDPQTKKHIVNVPEYRLATYNNKDQVLLRGCISKNVCENSRQRLVPMTHLLRKSMLSGNSIDVYLQAIEQYALQKKFECDLDSIWRTIIKDSFFNWKIANSDNHKNNILFRIETPENGKPKLDVCPLIDNGSAYELSVRYMNDDNNIRLEQLFTDNNFSRENDEGKRELAFSHYPYMHTAFKLEPNSLLISDTQIAGKNYAYEYCLASEMLSDNELYHQIYEIDRQLNPETAINAINEKYGTSTKGAPKSINWPPYLKEFMYATNEFKTKVLTYVVADYYLQSVAMSFGSDSIRKSITQNYNSIHDEFINTPLQASKDLYDELFVKISNKYGITIDKSQLASVQFKKDNELTKAQQETN